jgi:predicted O-methyltransferase YrrM
MELIYPQAEKYAEQFTSPEDELLTQIHKHTLETHAHAHMLSSRVQGKFLSFLSTFLQPKYVLEVGTFTGFSALCLAQGLQKDGELHTIELREEDAETARKNFSISQFNNKIHLHTGNASGIIPTLNLEWDLVFIDADKTGYLQYYELILPQLNKRGLIIADNVLFHGQVLEDTVKGKNAMAIHEFNRHVANDDRTEQVLLTVRDGLLLIKKKNS